MVNLYFLIYIYVNVDEAVNIFIFQQLFFHSYALW